MSTIDELLAISHVYTREQFDADYKRVVARICEKHGIAASEVTALIREHRYHHDAEDIEDEYIQIMAFAQHAGWVTPTCDFRDDHDPVTDMPRGPACGKPATHRIEWEDGRYSLGCDAHLTIDATATVKPVRIVPLKEIP